MTRHGFLSAEVANSVDFLALSDISNNLNENNCLGKCLTSHCWSKVQLHIIPHQLLTGFMVVRYKNVESIFFQQSRSTSISIRKLLCPMFSMSYLCRYKPLILAKISMRFLHPGHMLVLKCLKCVPALSPCHNTFIQDVVHICDIYSKRSREALQLSLGQDFWNVSF